MSFCHVFASFARRRAHTLSSHRVFVYFYLENDVNYVGRLGIVFFFFPTIRSFRWKKRIIAIIIRARTDVHVFVMQLETTFLSLLRFQAAELVVDMDNMDRVSGKTCRIRRWRVFFSGGQRLAAQRDTRAQTTQSR